MTVEFVAKIVNILEIEEEFDIFSYICTQNVKDYEATFAPNSYDEDFSLPSGNVGKHCQHLPGTKCSNKDAA
jgi:hypothetical protein